MDAEVAAVLEAHRRVTTAGAVQRGRSVVLQVAGAEQHQRHRDDRRRAPLDELVDRGVEVGSGQLDEATADREFGRLVAHRGRKVPVLGHAGRRAAPVPDEEQRRVVSHGHGREPSWPWR